MAGHVAPGEVGEGEPARRRGRIAARLYDVDHRLGAFPRAVGVERPVDAERHPPRRPAGAGLHHIDLAPRGVDPDPEPGERAVPEDRVPVGGAEPVDRAGANA